MSATTPRTKRPPSGRGSRRRRALAMVAVAILAAALCIPRPAATSASWTDGENARAQLQALTVPMPAHLICSARNNGTLGAFSSLTLTWNTAGAGYGYQVGASTASNGPYTIAANATISDNGNGTWSTSLSSGLLGGLLGGVLGGTSYYSVRATLGSWSSGWAPQVTLKIPILGGLLGSGTCSPTS